GVARIGAGGNGATDAGHVGAIAAHAHAGACRIAAAPIDTQVAHAREGARARAAVGQRILASAADAARRRSAFGLGHACGGAVATAAIAEERRARRRSSGALGERRAHARCGRAGLTVATARDVAADAAHANVRLALSAARAGLAIADRRDAVAAHAEE